MITHKISLTGMQKEDEQKISEVLHDVWGVRNIKINTEQQEAIISYDEKAASLIDFQQALIDTGFDIENKVE